MTFRSIARGLMLVAVLLSGMACGDRGLTDPSVCTAAVVVSVGRGLQPVIGWQPACVATSVTVLPAGGTLALPVWQGWIVLGGVTPPVRVGASPPGNAVWGAGESLTPGAPYTIYVARGFRDPSAGEDSLTFIAQP
jgi:hypothetical protein